jgi:hypothetical protein
MNPHEDIITSFRSRRRRREDRQKQAIFICNGGAVTRGEITGLRTTRGIYISYKELSGRIRRLRGFKS